MDDNPFSLLFNALWDLAESPSMETLVKPGNRIKFNLETTRDPQKTEVMDADLPELVLMVESASGNIHANSNQSSLEREYAFWLSTGDFRTNYRLHPVEWALYCAMADWKSVLGALTWRDKKFVKKLDFVGGTTGISNQQLNRGITGWSSIWRCRITMYFETSDLMTSRSSSSSSS